jgi:hypothetical protein
MKSSSYDDAQIYPVGFSLKPVPITAGELDGSTLFVKKSVFEVPMWAFSSGKRTLRANKPISVRISQGEELFFAEHDYLDVFATGETPASAVASFSELLVGFYDHYRQVGWDSVKDEAERLKYVYEDIFAEI